MQAAAVILLALFVGDPAELAPGPQQLEDARAATQSLVTRATAISRALARVHNTWADRRAAGVTGCQDPSLAPLPARSQILDVALRDATKSATVAAKRLRRIATSPTVTPLISPAQRKQIDALLAAADDLARRQAEIATWQRRYMVRALRSCPPLAAGPGLGSGTEAAPVAVIVSGDGVVCPGGKRPFNRVAVVTGPTCYGADGGCGCTPAPVAPAAVLP